MNKYLLAAFLAMTAVAAAQKPFHAESTSSIKVEIKEGYPNIAIHNVTYQHTGTRIPGRPDDESLALRITTHNQDAIGDIPEPGKVTLEAWPLGVDLQQKPIYEIRIGGNGARTVDDALWAIDRGYVDLTMYSIYKLGTGQHLFDTYVDLVRFSITKDIQTQRYVGLELPPDDVADARLKDPHVVGVLTYASGDRVIRELLLTHSNPEKARDMRSSEDTERSVAFIESPTKRLRIRFTPGAGGPPPTEVTVPLKGDDLDPAGARLPPGMRIAAWRR